MYKVFYTLYVSSILKKCHSILYLDTLRYMCVLKSQFTDKITTQTYKCKITFFNFYITSLIKWTIWTIA